MKNFYSNKPKTITGLKVALAIFSIALAYTVFFRDADANTITEGQLFLALMISILNSEYTTEKLRHDIEKQTKQQ